MPQSLSAVERPNRVEPDQKNICQIYNQYGIDKIEELEMVIGDQMNKRGWSKYEDSDEFRNALVASFEDAYLQASGKIVIPEAMTIAIVDASYWLMEQDPSPTGRIGTKIAPMITQKVGYIMPAYADRGLGAEGHLQFLPGDNGSASNPQF